MRALCVYSVSQKPFWSISQKSINIRVEYVAVFWLYTKHNFISEFTFKCLSNRFGGGMVEDQSISHPFRGHTLSMFKRNFIISNAIDITALLVWCTSMCTRRVRLHQHYLPCPLCPRSQPSPNTSYYSSRRRH